MKRFILAAAAALITAGSLAAADLIPMMDSYNGKWGFSTPTGYMIIKARYDNVRKFREGFAAVERDHKSGFINEQGRIIVKIKYQFVEDFNNGFAIVQRDNKWGAVNTTGEEVVPCEFDTKEELGDLILSAKGSTMVIRSKNRKVIIKD